MYTIYRKASPNKIRDINIAIAYHNTGRTLADLSREFGIAPERVRQIHHGLVRHMGRCIGLKDVYFHAEHKNHSEQMSIYLQEYKYLLEEGELRTEITLDNEDGQPALTLSTCIDDGRVIIHVWDDIEEADISIDDLKLALKKLCTKQG